MKNILLFSFLGLFLLTSVLVFVPAFGISCTQEEYDYALSYCLDEVNRLCQTAEVCEIVRNACYDAARQACDTIVVSDSDGDGINDNVDSCPTQPETYNDYEDSDGCPDTKPSKDSDGDGINDNVDSCPTQPETYNKYQDDDGCPDESASCITCLPENFFPPTIPDDFFTVNGCGPQNAKIDVIPDFDFSKSCDQHDICYSRGGDARDREICDEQMYESIKSNSVLGKFGGIVAWTIVHYGGESSFNCDVDSCK